MHRILILIFLLPFAGINGQPDNSIFRTYSLDHVNTLIKTTKDPDTLVAAYYHRARKTFLKSNEECRVLFEECLPIIKELGKDSVYYQAKMFYVLPLINGTRFEEAYSQIKECQKYYSEKNDLFRLASAYAVEGFLQEELSNFYLAADLFRQALGIYQNNDFENVHYGINNVHNHLGIIYSALGDNKKAAEYFEKVRKYSEENNVTYFKRAATNNLAECLIALGKEEEAIPMIEEVIELRRASSSNVSKISMYDNLARLAQIKNDLPRAIVYQDSAIHFAEKLDNHLFIVQNYLTKSRLHKSIGEYSKEKDALEKAMRFSSDFGTSSYLPEIYLALGEVEMKAKNSIKAGTYFQRHILLKDSLNKKQQLQDLERKEVAMAIQRYSAELEKINADANLKSLELEKQKQRNRFLIIFSFFTIGLIALLYHNNRVKKKNQMVLAIQNTEIESNLEDKEILLKEIHHRVKNNLQVVSSMLNLNLRYIKDDSAKEILLESRNRVKSMALIHQKLYQEDHLKGVGLRSYLESLSNSLLYSYKKKGREIQTHIQAEEMVLDVDTLIPFGLIVNEIISNSLKHAFVGRARGNIWIEVFKEEEILHLIIRDDGEGYVSDKMTEDQTSFGMTLISSLAEKLKADVSVGHERGTEVYLKIRKFSI